MAPVGQASRQRWHDPQPSGTGSAAVGSGASVRTEPSTTQLPMPGRQHHGVLAEPADAGPVGRGPVDQRVVVEHHPGLPAVGPQPVGHDVERSPQRAVVVARGVAGHAGVRSSVPRLGCRRAVVPAGPDHQRGHAGKGSGRVGRASRVAVGELHRAGQPLGLALARGSPGSRRTARPTRSRPGRARPPARARTAPRRSGGVGGHHVAIVPRPDQPSVPANDNTHVRDAARARRPTARCPMSWHEPPRSTPAHSTPTAGRPLPTELARTATVHPRTLDPHRRPHAAH